VIDRTLNYGFTDARWQQTANYGYLPNEAMPRTFLAVTIDLPDEIPDESNNQSTNARYDMMSALHLSHWCYCQRALSGLWHCTARYAARTHLVLLTLCGLTSQKTHRGGLELSGLVHEEAHPSFPYSA